MSATVTVSKGRNGKFRVTLTSARGKELLTSEPFSDKRSAAGVVRSLRGALPNDTAFVDSTTERNDRASTNGTATAKPATRRPRQTR
jgi:uncharacterized protein YegP (UPF0339 family)